MRKLITAVMLILFSIAFISCNSKENYYEQMEQLEEPIVISIGLTRDVWVSHEYRLNELEVLYYSPKILTVGEETYINDTEQYFIYQEDGGLFSQKVTYVTMETLREIFKE